MTSNLARLDKYLYQFTADHYDLDDATEYIEARENSDFNLPFPSCSTIRSGDFLGRNFDFFYSDLVDFVIHTHHSCEHFASVSVGCSLGEYTAHNIQHGISDEMLNILPYLVWDGINEYGVTFSTNVVPSMDLEEQTTGTNPGKPLLYSLFIGRIILDHATSARNAIKILKNYNIVTPNLSVLGKIEDLHFMIADECETYVVEFINNRLVYKKANLMTNFYVNLPLQPHSGGVERYNRLKKNYTSAGQSMKHMANLMEHTHYTQAYNQYTTPFWYSEHLLLGLEDGIELTVYNMHEYEDYIRDKVAKISFKERGILSPWHTTHTSIYDIINRKLRIFVQENYKKQFDFTVTSR